MTSNGVSNPPSSGPVLGPSNRPLQSLATQIATAKAKKDEKAAGIWTRCKNWFGSTKDASIAWVSSTKPALYVMTKKLDTELQEIVISQEMRASLKQFAPKLIEYLLTIPVVETYLKPIYTNRKEALDAAFENVLVYGVGNLICNSKKQQGKDLTTGSDIAAHLFNIIQEKLSNNNGRLQKEIDDPHTPKEQRDKCINEVFKPILDLAFPFGADDIPVRNISIPIINYTSLDLRKIIWDGINTPEFLTGLYDLFTKDLALTAWIKPSSEFQARRKELSTTPNGRLALGLSKYITRTVMNDVLPPFMDNVLVKIIAQSTGDSIHESIQKFSPELGAGLGQLKQIAIQWLEDSTHSVMRNCSTAVTESAMAKLQELCPAFAKESDAVKSKVQSDLLKRIAQWSLLKDPSSDKISQEIVESVDKLVPVLQQTTPGSLQEFSKWLSWKLDLTVKQDPYAEIIWKFASDHLEGIILDIFFPPNRPQKSVSLIFTRCLDVTHLHQEIIRQKYEELTKLTANTPQAVAKQNEINECFQKFSRDLMVVLEVEKDKKLALLFDVIKDQFARLMMEKIYPAFVHPHQNYNNVTFFELCNAVYDKSYRLNGKKGLDPLDKTLSDPAFLTKDQQKQLWITSNAQAQAKDFELFCKGVAAPAIKSAAQQYFADSAAEMLNECLGLDLDKEALELFHKEIQTVAKVDTPAKKAAWDYFENVAQVSLPKIFIALMEEMDKENPQSNADPATHKIKTVPERFTTQLVAWADKHLKEEVNPKTHAKRTSFEDLCTRGKHLQMKLQQPKLILKRLELLKTKLEHRLPVLQAKLRARQIAANSLPPHQKADKVKLISDLQEELQNTEKKLEEELKRLQEELTKAEEDLKTNQAQYASELQSIQQVLKERILELSKDLLGKLGKDINNPKHVMYDLPLLPNLKKNIWENLVPDILCTTILQHHQFICPDTHSLEDELSILYGDECIQDLGEALDKFAGSFMPHMLANDEEITKQLFEIMQEMLPAGQVSSDEFRKFIKDNQKELLSVLTSNTNSIGKSQHPVLKKLYSFLGTSSESFSTIVLHGLSKRVLEMQAKDPLAMAKYTTKEMIRFADYVEVVNGITKKSGAKYPYNVNPTVMLHQLQQKQEEFEKQFTDQLAAKRTEWEKASPQDKQAKAEAYHALKRTGSKQILHPALRKHFVTQKDGTTRELTRDEAKMENLFRPLAKKILKISGIAPTRGNEKLHQFMEDVLFPILIQVLYNSSTSRPAMKQMQLTLVNNLQAVCADIERQLLGEYHPQTSSQNGSSATDNTDEGLKKVMTRMGKLILELVKWLGQSITTNVVQNNPVNVPTNLKGMSAQEKEMIIASGKILRELIDWMPGTASNALIKNFDQIKKMTEEQLGTVTSDFIAQRDILEDFFKPILQTSTSCIHPGKWENNRFKTPKQEKLPNGQTKNKWEFNFNVTRQDLIQRKAAEKTTENLAARRTRDLANHGIDVTIMQTMNTFRQEVWIRVAIGIQRATEAIFKEYYKPVQFVLKSIFALIGAIAMLIFYGIAFAFILPYAAFSRAHTWLQVYHLDKNASMEINHSMIMYALEDFVDAVEKSMEKNTQTALQKPPPSPKDVFNSQWNDSLKQINALQTQLTQLSQSLRKQSGLPHSQKVVI